MKNNKQNKFIFIALPASVIAGILTFFTIANKDIPLYQDTETIKNRIKEVEQDYVSLHKYRTYTFTRNAERTPDIIALQQQLDTTQNDTTKAQLSNKIENLRDSLVSDALQNDETLNYIFQNAQDLCNLERSMNASNEKRAEMLKVPALKRFNKNWAEIKNDFRRFYLEKQR